MLFAAQIWVCTVHRSYFWEAAVESARTLWFCRLSESPSTAEKTAALSFSNRAPKDSPTPQVSRPKCLEVYSGLSECQWRTGRGSQCHHISSCCSFEAESEAAVCTPWSCWSQLREYPLCAWSRWLFAHGLQATKPHLWLCSLEYQYLCLAPARPASCRSEHWLSSRTSVWSPPLWPYLQEVAPSPASSSRGSGGTKSCTGCAHQTFTGSFA